jgi:Concanavalin A-like lectin/glucanases superfamily
MGDTRSWRGVNRRLAAAAAVTGVALGVTAAPAVAFNNPIMAAWPIDEGSGQSVHDFSGHDNRGVLGGSSAADSGDPAWIALPSSRYYRRSALRFAGDDYVTVADSATLEPARISVGAIVRATASPGAFRYVVSKGALQCVTASYGLYTGHDGGLIFYVSNGTQVVLSADAGAALWDGAWHVVLGTFDGAVVRLFVDGREVGSGTPTSISLAFGFPDNDAFYIGDYRGTCANPLGFVGDIDAVAVANRAIDWSGD